MKESDAITGFGINISKAIRRIDRHLSDIEKEYRKKGIERKIRSDWGYAFYTGKFVAYLYIIDYFRYPVKITDKKVIGRIKGMGLNIRY